MKDFLERLREANKERNIEWAQGDVLDALFFAVEFAGEAGEVSNEVKKLVREDRGWRGSRTTIQKLAEEMADAVITLDNLASIYGIDLREAVIAKFNKTSEKVGLSQRLY